MSFVKDYFLYSVPKNEKSLIRKTLIKEDHKGYCICLLIIAVLQILMLVRSFVIYGAVVGDRPWILQYRLLYSILAVACLVSIPLTSVVVKKNRDLLYFWHIGVMMVIIDLWSVGISLLDSHESVELTTYAYVTIAIAVFMVLEPWVMALNLVAVCVVLNLSFLLIPGVSNHYSSSVIVNSASVLILAIMAGTFNFYRRVKKLNLEREITTLNEILSEKAQKDDLTGLYNRHFLTERINTFMNVGLNPTGVMMFDIDHFKEVNDIYGHMAGDEVLRTLGKVVNTFVTEDGYAVRYGGEEFLLYYGRTTKEELSSLAEGLRVALSKADVKLSDGTIVNFTVSIGTAVASSGISYAGLINKSDVALYNAKKTRNTVCEAE